MKMKSNKNSKGTIICTRIVRYDEIVSLGKGLSVKTAAERVMQAEQEKWKRDHKELLSTNKNWQNSFFKDCFPKWTYILDGVECASSDVKSAIDNGVVWDIELKVEYDPKLTAYRLLNEKE